MMRILSQPRDGNLLTEFSNAISRDDYGKFSELRIVVAYAKLSGVHQLLPHLTSFQAAGGQVEVIVGIGQKNTSKEAIEELAKLGASVSIFHRPGSLQRTFHPKAYILSSKSTAWSSVGSSNMTRGGLDTNYEWNTLSAYDLEDPYDLAAFKALRGVFIALLPANNPSSKKATPALIEDLHDRGVLPSEAQLRKATAKAAKQEASEGLGDLFDEEKLPEPASKAVKTLSKSGAKTTKKIAVPAKPLATGFWKRMSSGDVSKTSSPGQIIVPKAGWPYFPALGEFELKESGSQQADSYFDVLFHDGEGNTLYVSNTRRIHYIPAPTHGRKNEESRFTFRHRSGVFDTLKKGDVLEFRRTASQGAWFDITRVPKEDADDKYPDDDHGVF